MSEAARQLLTEWNWEPSVVIGAILIVAAYLAASGPFRSHFKASQRTDIRQVAAFLCGMGLIVFALVSPLDAIGDSYLFTAHMLQHTLLLVAAPPLLLVGLPGWMLRPLLLHPTIKPITQFLTRAPLAFLLFNFDMLLWHLPVPYEATLENETIHIVEHLSFIVLGVLNMWPLLSPLPELSRLTYPGQILYLLLDMVPSMILGFVFVSVTTVLYPTYAAAPHVFAIYGVGDQVVGGYMMAMPSGAIYLGMLLHILSQWSARSEHKT